MVHLCNNVSLIAPPNLYFRKPAIVEILITNLRESLFITVVKNVFYVFLFFYKNMFFNVFYYSVYVFIKKTIYNILTWPKGP